MWILGLGINNVTQKSPTYTISYVGFIRGTAIFFLISLSVSGRVVDKVCKAENSDEAGCCWQGWQRKKKDKTLHYFETFSYSVKCQRVYLSKKSETGNTKSYIFSCASCEAFCHYENTSQLVCFNLGLCTFCILWHFSKNSSSLKLFKQNFGTLQRQRSLTNRPIHLYLIFENSNWKNQV